MVRGRSRLDGTRCGPPRVPTEEAILARDRYECQCPGCTSRRGLRAHYIVPLSEGGSDTPENQVTLCAGHRSIIRDGHARVFGRAPDDLTWELGIRPGRPPMRVYRGQKLIRSEID